MSFLARLRLSRKRERELDDEVRRLSSILDFSRALVDALQKCRLSEAVVIAAPWVGSIVGVVSEAVPVLKVATSILDKISSKADQLELGLLACTLAFEHSVSQAITEFGPPSVPTPFAPSAEQCKDKLRELKNADVASLQYFSLKDPTNNPFVWQAMEAIRVPLWLAGYGAPELRRLESIILDRFRESLILILSAPETKDKFAPFRKMAELGSEEIRAHALLNRYVCKQCDEYTQIPEGQALAFSLSQVYVNLECAVLAWQEIRPDAHSRTSKDVFSGPRDDLLEKTLSLLGDDKLRQPIVVQGMAGAGKSAFTLRLAVQLLREGLVPIRVRISNLRTDLRLLKAIHEAIVNTPDLFVPGQFSKPADILLEGTVFNEPTKFRNATISRYILILDGWDEVSTAEKRYQDAVNRFLESTRSELISRHNPPVRVVLTGRPSHAVFDASFLDDDTPILAIQPYTREQLRLYLDKLKSTFPDNPKIGATVACIARDLARSGEDDSLLLLDVLGQPLLAVLAVLLAVDCKDEALIGDLFSDKTGLYRRLIDVTCEKAGKGNIGTDKDSIRMARIRGPNLRSALWRTAVAMTTLGKERISFSELVPRARLSESDQSKMTTDQGASGSWTHLIISFFFKAGGLHHGLEFMHKSFREYLFAEALVECLKRYGARQVEPVQVRSTQNYAQDFQDVSGDQRYSISRELSELISAQEISPEIREHILSLLRWELNRASPAVRIQDPLATADISLGSWEHVRDLLSELWGWWLSRTPSRMQLEKDPETGCTVLRTPYTVELIKLAAQRDRLPGTEVTPPPSSIGVDGLLGSALLFLTTAVFSALQKQQGWQGDWLDKGIDQKRSPHLTEVSSSAGTISVFSPNTRKTDLRNALGRIELGLNTGTLAGTRLSLSGLDLCGADLYCVPFIGADFSYADLSDSDFSGCVLEGTKFKGANLQRADFFTAYLAEVDLTGADLSAAKLANAYGVSKEQVASAFGDERTTLPVGIDRPSNWRSKD